MLSDEQIEKLGSGNNTPNTTPSFFRFARAIESAARREALNDAIIKLNANVELLLMKQECIEEIRALIDQPAAHPECPSQLMTLDEAIAHAEERGKGSDGCSANHRQLAAWLRELRTSAALPEPPECHRVIGPLCGVDNKENT